MQRRGNLYVIKDPVRKTSEVTRFKRQDSRDTIQETRFKRQDSRDKIQGTRFKGQGSRDKIQETRLWLCMVQSARVTRYINLQRVAVRHDIAR
jgi:hypothetical protein